MTCEKLDSDFPDTIIAMIVSLRHFLGWLVGTFRSREDLVLENLALRRQLLALHAQQPRRRLTALHKLFWVALRTCWSGWRKPLVLVTPRSVVNWHGAGFRLYWTWISRFRRVGGRKGVSKEVRALIFRRSPRIRPGERRAFTANCSSWVSISRKGVSRDGSGESREIQIS